MFFYILVHFILAVFLHVMFTLEINRFVKKDMKNRLKLQLMLALGVMVVFYLLRSYIGVLTPLLIYLVIYSHKSHVVKDIYIANKMNRIGILTISYMIILAIVGQYLLPQPWLYDANWAFDLRDVVN